MAQFSPLCMIRTTKPWAHVCLLRRSRLAGRGIHLEYPVLSKSCHHPRFNLFLHNHPEWGRRAVHGGDLAVLARRTAVSIFVLSTPSLIVRSEILRQPLYGKNFVLDLLMRAMQNDSAVAGGGAIDMEPSSWYDAGSSEQVFCTWLIRE